MEANKITLKTLAVSTLTVLSLEAVFQLTVAGNTSSSLPLLGVLRFIEIIVLVFISLRIEKDAGAIGLAPEGMLPGFKKGLVWSACFGIAAAVLFLVLFVAGINPLKLVQSTVPSSWKQILIFFMVGGVIGPIAEEIFFRGIIYGFFRRWGIYAAVAMSTLLFVFTHPVGRNLPVTQLVGGIVFAVAYEKGKSLLVPITIHTLGNIAIFSLTFLF